jgi:hypothetical protein
VDAPVTGRLVPLALVSALAAVAVVAVAFGGRQAAAPPFDSQHRRTVGYGQIGFDFAGPERWALRYRREHARALELRRELAAARRSLLAKPTVVEAVNLAAAAYGHGPALWRKARCETGGTFSPSARNRASGAAGLFQFLPSTWRSTPFRRFSVWSPYANALAAGWMHAEGRGGEWSCR